jgi:transcriptional antiterminator NusG
MDVYDKDSVAELRKVNGVIDYVGGVHEPIPLTREELMKILVPLVSNVIETTEDVVKDYSRPDVSVGVKTGGAKIEVDFVIGDFIRIDGGPFNDMNGTITTINLEHERVQVLLSLFGRETTVELSLNQVVKEKQS